MHENFQANCKRQKAALTRAKKIGPQAVIDVCDIALGSFDVFGWPDYWSDFEREKGDAEMILRMQSSKPW